MKFDVKYETLNDSSSQYDDIEFERGVPTYARYVKAVLEVDKGNIFIEALPGPRTEKEIDIAYETDIPSYSYEKTKSMTSAEKMMNVGLLKNLRFNLPFHQQLEHALYNALLTSYRSRKVYLSDNSAVHNIIHNDTKLNTGILVGDSAASTNAGFSLIGYSGCGKSSAIDILVSHYPQVLIHKIGEYAYFPQITYLVVNCVANSNFAALYEGIGDAIDKALGNIEPVYAKEIDKCRNLGSKAEKIRTFIERFAIGAIIFDEIQLIDFEHTRENTFDSLLTLANKTKTAIIVVGTEDAKDKMFSELRTSRRLGMMINGNAYCGNKRFFDCLVDSLFYYQWFDEPVECTQEICDTLFELTKGIIDQLISLYSAVHIEYLSTNKKPIVDGQYFRKVAQKYYPGIQNVLANLENIENVSKRNEICHKADDMLNNMIDIAKQNEKAEKMIQSAHQNADKTILLHNVVSNINNIDNFSDDQIQDAFKKIMSRKSSEKMSEKEITKLVYEQLNKLPRKNNPKTKTTMDLNDYKSFLRIEG